ncbi:MAG: DUF6226 family protein [bacterium]|nr:DUF6226 family protein [bacterium]
MSSVEELVAAVDAAFVETGRGLSGWPDPHPDRMPLDEEYSRLTNPQRWKILIARVEAWLEALVAAGLAETEEAFVVWREPPRVTVSRTFRAVPQAPGALPLVVAWKRFEEIGWPAVVLGVGDPAEVVAVIPDCACDACDSGSQVVLDELDEYILGVVTGAYRRLWRGRRKITVYSDDQMSRSGFERRRVNFTRLFPGRFVGIPRAATSEMATDGYYTLQAIDFQGKSKWLNALRRAIADRWEGGSSHRKELKKLEEVLAHPKGWNEIHGSSWLDGNPTNASEGRG